MKIVSFEFSNIRNFRSLHLSVENDVILVGQNDHGKSSVFKVLDVLFNGLKAEHFKEGSALPEDIYDIINPAFSIGKSARRVTIAVDGGEKPYVLTFKEGSVTVFRGKPKRGMVSEPSAISSLFTLLEKYVYIHIPAARDVKSGEFVALFQRIMNERGLNQIIPTVGGGTRREYRLLKNIRQQLEEGVMPFLDETVLPQIRDNLPIELPNDLRIDFRVDLRRLIQWINDSLSLAVVLSDGKSMVSIDEVGSGIQSLLMLSLQRVAILSQKHKNQQFVLAVEEPEAFLHPQAQRDIADFLRKELSGQQNVRLMLSTHSPYILNAFSLDQVRLIRKKGDVSRLLVPVIKGKDAEILNDFNNEINSEIFFARAVVFVEGETDKRVLYRTLYNIHSVLRGHVTIIDVGGNKSFSPYLRLIKCLSSSGIPWGLITDFDSLVKTDGERPLIRGVKDAGVRLSVADQQLVEDAVQAAVDRDESDHEGCSKKVSQMLAKYGVNAFIFPSDLEWALCTDALRVRVCEIIQANSGADVSELTLSQLKKKLGSKGISGEQSANPIKKAFIHEKIAAETSSDNIHPSLLRATDFIKTLIDASAKEADGVSGV